MVKKRFYIARYGLKLIEIPKGMHIDREHIDKRNTI